MRADREEERERRERVSWGQTERMREREERKG